VNILQMMKQLSALDGASFSFVLIIYHNNVLGWRDGVMPWIW